MISSLKLGSNHKVKRFYGRSIYFASQGTPQASQQWILKEFLMYLFFSFKSTPVLCARESMLFINLTVFSWNSNTELALICTMQVSTLGPLSPSSSSAQSAGVDLNEKKRYIKNSFKIHFWDANGTSGGAKKFNLPQKLIHKKKIKGFYY